VQQHDGNVSPDRIIARLASKSHGVVSRGELQAAGVSPEAIRTRLRKGSLIGVHRGVYRVGHRAPSREATYLAAVKACGDGAVLCGRAAAHLWRLIKGPPPQPEVRHTTKRVVPGVVTHRVKEIPAGEMSERDGISITSVPRTLVDLASSLPEPALARACHEAGVQYGTTPRQVDKVLARLPNPRGRAKLEKVLRGEARVTLSRLEAQFLARLRKAKLPLPVTNRVAGGFRVDCRWPDHRLTVELDSYRYHNSRHAFEKDRLRDREARARGDELRRYTWRDVSEEPEYMLSELRGLLCR
jgi:very-short-patch-repair endonuclease